MRRNATTLIEVLIAIFVMALGLIALLTLFPVGASQMAKSIQNERAAQVAASAASYFRINWKAMCDAEAATMKGPSMFHVDMTDPNMGIKALFFKKKLQQFPFAMDDPNAGVPDGYRLASMPYAQPATAPPGMGGGIAALNHSANNINMMASANTPGFPVLLDPVGFEANANSNPNGQWWYGTQPLVNAPTGMPKTAIPRRTLPQFVANTTKPKDEVFRNFFLLDDMTFKDGAPQGVGGTVERAGQYSHAYLLRRGINNTRSEVDLTVVVYQGRTLDSPTSEASYWASYDPTIQPTTVPTVFTVVMPSVVTLSYASPDDRPALKRGSWVLDATMLPMPKLGGGMTYQYQGQFYRVSEVRDGTNPNTMDVYLDSPLKPGGEYVGESGNLFPAKPNRLFVVVEGVIDVFNKGTVSMLSPNRIN